MALFVGQQQQQQQHPPPPLPAPSDISTVLVLVLARSQQYHIRVPRRSTSRGQDEYSYRTVAASL